MMADFHSRTIARLCNPELGLGLGLPAGGPNSGPAAAFDFLASDTLDSRIGFTRGSAATRVNASGLIEVVGDNVPRFDYDPVTLAPKGLLIEEQRTNFLVHSEFANGLPASRGGPVSVAPFAGLTMGTGLAIGSGGEAYIYVTNYTAKDFTSYVISVFVRMDDGGIPAFGNSDYYHPSNDFVFNIGGTVVSPHVSNEGKVENYGNGIYRVGVTITTVASPGANCGLIKYASNSPRTFKISGIMVEQGAFATSYIPTGASQVTRASESGVIAASDFASLWRADQGAFVVQADTLARASAAKPRVLEVTNGTDTEAIRLLIANGRQFQGVDDGVIQWDLDVFDPSDGDAATIAAAYAPNDIALSVNGGAVALASSAALPRVDRLTLGAGVAGSGYLNGHIRSIRYYSTRLANGELQRLSA